MKVGAFLLLLFLLGCRIIEYQELKRTCSAPEITETAYRMTSSILCNEVTIKCYDKERRNCFADFSTFRMDLCIWTSDGVSWCKYDDEEPRWVPWLKQYE